MDNNSISSWIEKKRKEYGSLVKLPELIPSLLTELAEKAENFNFAESEKSFKLRRRLDFHSKIKPEHLWERFITQSMPEEIFFNQFSLTGTNNIDLLKTDEIGKRITHIIELKTGSNELGHAAYEIIFYYLLLLQAKKKPLVKYELAEPMNLIIIAPEYYCKTQYQDNFLKEMQTNLNKDSKYKKAKIKFISLPQSDDKEIMKETTKKIRNEIVGKEIPLDTLIDLRKFFKNNL